MASKNDSTSKKNSLILDPEKDKERFKDRISKSIENRVPSADEEEVEHLVDEKYEELLEHASVKKHIPTLVEGEVFSEVKHPHSHDDTKDD